MSLVQTKENNENAVVMGKGAEKKYLMECKIDH